MNLSNRTDPSLVRACLDGQPRAWDALVERYERLVYSVALKSRLSPSDADDVFQMVFLSLYRNLSQVRDQARLSAWLITCTHREAWRVAKRRMKTLDDASAEFEPSAFDPDEIEADEQQHIVRQSLTELGGPCEDLLKALFFQTDEPAYDEIAARLAMPIGSIGPTRARCLKKLERILSHHGFATDESVIGRKDS
jgi:RNA polymerase sigma factor (sigma-70 family)